MPHQCSICPYSSSSLEEFCDHLYKRHCNEASFIVHCYVCGASFRKKNSFRSHYYRNHYCEVDRVADVYELDTEQCSAIVSAADGSEQEMVEYSQCNEAAFLLKLKAGHRLSCSAVADVMSATKELFSSKMLQLQQNIQTHGLVGPEAVTYQISDAANNLFSGLETDHLQVKAFQTHLGYIPPVNVELGVIRQNMLNASKYVLENRVACGHIVPFLKQLQQLVSMPEVHHSLCNFPCNSYCETTSHMTDIHEGKALESDDFFQRHPNGLLFCLYTDEFEIVNPIGSHKKKHKIIAFYWILLNIPVEHRSKLRAIQLCALAKASFVKQFGVSKLLQNFCDGLNALHHGVDLNVPRYGNRKYFGKLCFVLADTLAAHSLGGFKEGVGAAIRPCRTCDITKTNMAGVHWAGDCQLRDEREHQERLEMLQMISKPARQYWSKEWGVNDGTILAAIPDPDSQKVYCMTPCTTSWKVLPDLRFGQCCICSSCHRSCLHCNCSTAGYKTLSMITVNEKINLSCWTKNCSNQDQH